MRRDACQITSGCDCSVPRVRAIPAQGVGSTAQTGPGARSMPALGVAQGMGSAAKTGLKARSIGPEEQAFHFEYPLGIQTAPELENHG
jgi:hypothetical protein